jgi:uncharacterized cupin superfamily protein
MRTRASAAKEAVRDADVAECLLWSEQMEGYAQGIAHHLLNRTESDVTYLEIGDRTPGDEGSYPADDIQALLAPDGKWQFMHKDGRRY